MEAKEDPRALLAAPLRLNAFLALAVSSSAALARAAAFVPSLKAPARLFSAASALLLHLLASLRDTCNRSSIALFSFSIAATADDANADACALPLLLLLLLLVVVVTRLLAFLLASAAAERSFSPFFSSLERMRSNRSRRLLHRLRVLCCVVLCYVVLCLCVARFVRRR